MKCMTKYRQKGGQKEKMKGVKYSMECLSFDHRPFANINLRKADGQNYLSSFGGVGGGGAASHIYIYNDASQSSCRMIHCLFQNIKKVRIYWYIIWTSE